MKSMIKSALAGMMVILVVCLLMAAIFAGLLVGGVLPEGSLGGIAGIITVFACFLGGLTGAKISDSMALPVALLSGVGYLGVVFVLRGICFHSVGAAPGIVVLLAAIGVFFGAMAGTVNKK